MTLTSSTYNQLLTQPLKFVVPPWLDSKDHVKSKTISESTIKSHAYINKIIQNIAKV